MASKLVRVNTTLSQELNEKLVFEAERIGVAKATIITMALDGYFQQKDAIKAMSDMGKIIEKLDVLEKKIGGK